MNATWPQTETALRFGNVERHFAFSRIGFIRWIIIIVKIIFLVECVECSSAIVHSAKEVKRAQSYDSRQRTVRRCRARDVLYTPPRYFRESINEFLIAISLSRELTWRRNYWPTRPLVIKNWIFYPDKIRTNLEHLKNKSNATGVVYRARHAPKSILLLLSRCLYIIIFNIPRSVAAVRVSTNDFQDRHENVRTLRYYDFFTRTQCSGVSRTEFRGLQKFSKSQLVLWWALPKKKTSSIRILYLHFN